MHRDEFTAMVASESPVEKFREFLDIRGEKLTEPRRVLVGHIFNSRKHFDELKNANLNNGGVVQKIETSMDQVARGKVRYGSNKAA